MLPHTELPLRSRTLRAERFRKGSKNVDAKAGNNPKKYDLDPACVHESNSEAYRRMYSVSYINV